MKTCVCCRQVLEVSCFGRHKSQADGLNYYCRECVARKAREARARNPQRYAMLARRWRAANRELSNRYGREHDARNYKKRRIKRQTREAILAYSQRRNRSAEAKIIQKRYLQSERGKEVTRARRARRNARIRGLDAVFTADQWRSTLSRQKQKCFYCKARFGDMRKPTMDHVIPLAKGGAHRMDNIVAACRSCNSSKQDKLVLLA